MNRCGILVAHLPSLPWGHGIPLGLALLCPPAVTKVETQVSKREANRPRASRVAGCDPNLCLPYLLGSPSSLPGVPICTYPGLPRCRCATQYVTVQGQGPPSLPNPQTYRFPRCSWDAGRPSESNGTLHRREGIRSHRRPPGVSQDPLPPPLSLPSLTGSSLPPSEARTLSATRGRARKHPQGPVPEH